MTCNNVVYFIPGNTQVSAYCGLEHGHKGACTYIPEEYMIRLCKQILIERGEVIVPMRRR